MDMWIEVKLVAMEGMYSIFQITLDSKFTVALASFWSEIDMTVF